MVNLLWENVGLGFSVELICKSAVHMCLPVAFHCSNVEFIRFVTVVILSCDKAYCFRLAHCGEMVPLQLTVPKKMADVHFTRMLCGRKSFKKTSNHLLKDRHLKRLYFLFCQNFPSLGIFLLVFLSDLYRGARNAFWSNVHDAIFFGMVN